MIYRTRQEILAAGRFPLCRVPYDSGDGFPQSIPWRVVERAQDAIEWGEGKSLRRVAENGGLSPLEVYRYVTQAPPGRIDRVILLAWFAGLRVGAGE